MIRSFADGETERFFQTGRSRRLPPDIFKRAGMRLMQINAAAQVSDLRLPPSNRLEVLLHDRAGQWSVRINPQDLLPEFLPPIGIDPNRTPRRHRRHHHTDSPALR